MRLSVCLTINDRPLDVLSRVFDSLRPQGHDEMVIVLDAPEPAVADFCKEYWHDDKRTAFVEVQRPAGWRSPVKAWNAGYRAISGDYLYCFSSETTQQPGNLDHARTLLSSNQYVIFGKCECSCGIYGREVEWGGTAPGNLLCDSKHPRPLGFIWAAPMATVRKIGGWDEAFDHGFWFDEADFFTRLWRAGLDFLFTDQIAGTHIHHDRPNLTQEGIATNQAYITAKHGSTDPLHNVLKQVQHERGSTWWRHI